MNREYPGNSVVIQCQSERQVDLLCDTRAAVTGVTLLNFYYCVDDFL